MAFGRASGDSGALAFGAGRTVPVWRRWWGFAVGRVGRRSQAVGRASAGSPAVGSAGCSGGMSFAGGRAGGDGGVRPSTRGWQRLTPVAEPWYKTWQRTSDPVTTFNAAPHHHST